MNLWWQLQLLQSWDKPSNKDVSAELSAGANACYDRMSRPLHILGQLKSSSPRHYMLLFSLPEVEQQQ